MIGIGTLILIALAVGSPPAESRTTVATCEEAVLGNPDIGARPIGFAEYPGWAEAAVRKPNGLFAIKLGAGVRGSAPVTVRVVPRHQDRAALVYGGHTSASQVRFEPCPDHARSTGWAGGVKLTELRRFTVEIRTPGRSPAREVLLDEPRRLPKP